MLSASSLGRMAANLVKRPVSSIVQKRLYAAAAAAHGHAASHTEKATGKLLPKDVQVGKAANGVLIAAQETYAPVSRIVAVVRAGPRFEKSQQLGASHCIRVAADQATKKSSAFGLTRSIQQLGGTLTCTSSREVLIYSLQVLRDSTEDAAQFLTAVATQQLFSPWEIADVQERLKFDLGQLQERPDVVVAEKLHEAAYRNQSAGLGRSLFAPRYQIGKLTSDTLRGFYNDNFGVSNIAVYGHGVEYSQIESIARSLTPAVGGGAGIEKAKYYGGEFREQTGSWLTHVLVAAEGASLSAKDLFAHGALQQLLGTGPYVKWSSQAAADGLAKAAAQATDRQFYIGAFNLNYSDSGLFGIQLTTQGSEVGKVLKAAMKEVLRLSKGVSDQDLARAKNQLKASLLYQQESSDAASEARALELLNTGAVAKADAALSAIDALSAGEVQAVAKKLVTAKMSMSAIGDLYATPYVDQLSA